MQNPVTLYSFRQKFCVAVLTKNEHFEKLADGGNVLDFVGAELIVYDRPYHVVALHGGERAVRVVRTKKISAMLWYVYF